MSVKIEKKFFPNSFGENKSTKMDFHIFSSLSAFFENKTLFCSLEDTPLVSGVTTGRIIKKRDL